MKVSDTILKKLTESLEPLEIEVIDESHQHKGHSGARDGGETHYAVFIKSAHFNGLTRVQRHKLVYKILDEEINNGVHALRISASSTEEK